MRTQTFLTSLTYLLLLFNVLCLSHGGVWFSEEPTNSTITDGGASHIVCKVSWGDADPPDFEVQWYKDGDFVNIDSTERYDFVVDHVNGTSGDWSLRIDPVKWEEDEAPWYCKLVDNDSNNETDSDVAYITVIVEPKLHLEDENGLELDETQTLLEETTIIIVCVAEESLPQSELKWYLVAEEITQENTTVIPSDTRPGTYTSTSQIEHTALSSHNDLYISCKASMVGETIDWFTQVKLNVEYAPTNLTLRSNNVQVANGSTIEVAWGDELILGCSVESNPPPVEKHEWEHAEHGVCQTGSTSTSTTTSTSNCTIIDATTDDEGVYICTAENKHGRLKGSVTLQVNTEDIGINDEFGDPVTLITDEREVGGNYNYTFYITSGAAITAVVWLWDGEINLQHNAVNTTDKTDNGRISSEFYRSGIQVTDYILLFDIHTINSDIFKDYTVVVVTKAEELAIAAIRLIDKSQVPVGDSCRTGLALGLTFLFLALIAAAVVGYLFWKKMLCFENKNNEKEESPFVFDNVGYSGDVEEGKRDRVSNGDIYEPYIYDDDDLKSNQLNKWTCKATKIPANKIVVVHARIGEGTFGEVFKAQAKDVNGRADVAVAVKKPLSSKAQLSMLQREIEVMHAVPTHEHILELFGYFEDPKTGTTLAMVTEYCELGSLKDLLIESRAPAQEESTADDPEVIQRYNYENLAAGSNTLPFRQLLKFALEIASGMNHLTRNGFLHRDLAARSILVTKDWTCKITNFGFARDITVIRQSIKRDRGRMPIRWMAIESLFYNVFNTKTDVWSYGILFWEIITLGAIPYSDLTSAEEVMQAIRAGEQLKKPVHCSSEIYEIMQNCWEDNPDDRPAFSDIYRRIEILLEEQGLYEQVVGNSVMLNSGEIASHLIGNDEVV